MQNPLKNPFEFRQSIMLHIHIYGLHKKVKQKAVYICAKQTINGF